MNLQAQEFTEIRSQAVSYHIIYYTISYYIISYHNISYSIMSYHNMSFIFIPWIRRELQNPYGYGNSHICLRSIEVDRQVYYNFS
jgi:hypothetical protein